MDIPADCLFPVVVCGAIFAGHRRYISMAQNVGEADSRSQNWEG